MRIYNSSIITDKLNAYMKLSRNLSNVKNNSKDKDKELKAV